MRRLDGADVSDIQYCLPCLEREARPAGTDWDPADCPLYGACPVGDWLRQLHAPGTGA